MLTTESDTRVDTLENSADEVVLALRTGRARFDVEPGGPRSWRIECGALVVEVVGTAFTIDRRRDTVEVEVHRGAVLVRGDRVPDRVQRLERGQSLRVAPPVVEPLAEATRREANQVPPTLGVEAPTTPAPAEAPPERPRGEDPERPAQIPSEPGTGEGGDVDSLLERADVARLSGQPAQAARALERLLDLHPEDPRAALSAFTLAQLRLEQLGQPRGAASAFAHSLSLGLPEGLRETAMARRVEALARAANPGVTIAAAAYLAAYPDGRYREEVHRWSGQ
jgi:transmembrane sensor